MFTSIGHGQSARWAGRNAWPGYCAGGFGLILVTVGAGAYRGHLNPVTISLAYLLVVLASAMLGGVGPGIATSVIGFLTFNFFFLPPYYTFIVGSPEDIVALFVFLVVAAITSELVSRLQQREQEARRRAVESETLSRLSTDLLTDVTLDTILATVVEQVPRVFELESAAVLLPEETGGLQLRSVYPPQSGGYYLVDREHRAVSSHVFRTGMAAGVGSATRAYRPHGPSAPGLPTARRHRRVLYVPVRAAHGPVGVMGVTAVRALDFSPEERRLLTTFANQAALAIDRARLIEEATRATALEEADRLKSALLTAVSHDLRTPLASIKAAATSLLQEDVPWDQETRQEFLHAIDEETDRLTLLVSNLLDLTRIQGGALKPEKEWYEIGEVIHRVADRLARQRADHPLSVEIREGLPLVAFDFVEIAQVLTNLIENAAKYSEAGKEIVVSASQTAASVRVSVRDRGLGIPAADLPHVFETFYRVRRQGEAARIRGTGLGLAICKGFVEAHGGTIGVESVSGEGSEFWFTLPITAMPDAPLTLSAVAEGSVAR